MNRKLARPHPRILSAWIFLLFGIALASLGIFSPILELDFAHASAVGFLGLVIAALGVLLMRRGIIERAQKPDADAASIPLPHYTRNCPFCGRRIGLKNEKCPHCKRKFSDGTTCSAGGSSAADAEAAFASAREAALAQGSTGYVWRATLDDATCERCANNDGHQFPWDREPIGGHAGARARCRCRAEALFPDSTAR